MTDKERKLVEHLESKGLYVHHYEPKRLAHLVRACEAAYLYTAHLDNHNRDKATSVSIMDLVKAWEIAKQEERRGNDGTI